MRNSVGKWGILLLVMLPMGRPSTLEAYDLRTHEALNEEAVRASDLDIHLRDLQFSNGVQEVLLNKSVIDWIGEGGILEDEPVARTLNHFHHPLRSPWQTAGLDEFPFTGTSSILWGQDVSQRFSWINARQAYLTALTASSRAERQRAFADTFRALGQVMHLIADASVPAHVRNDQHALPVPGDPYEEWLGEQAEPRFGETSEQAQERFLNTFVPSPKHPNDSFILAIPILGQDATDAPVPIARLWDTDQYDSTNPASTLSPRIGITEYTNGNFFSQDTVFANQLPATHLRFSPFPSSAEVEEFIDRINNRKYWRKINATLQEPQHLAAVSKRAFWQKAFGVGLETRGEVDDDRVYEDYAKLLLPRAVGYSAALLDYFFRGTLDFTVSASSTSSNQNELTITNTSAEAMDGTFTLYADNFSGGRSSVLGVSFNLSLGSGDTSGSIAFTPPSQIQAYILVFEGRLGNEDGAVAGKVNDWYAVTDVTPSTITVGQTTMLTITIKSNFSRKPRIITAALLNAHTGIHVSTSVTIPNTGHATTQIALDIASAPLPIDILRTPRPLSLVVVPDADFHSITRADLNNQNPVSTIMSLVRVGQNSRLPIYQRVVTGKIMWVSGPNGSSSITFLNAFDTTPFTFTWKFKNANLIKIFVAPIDKETDFTDGKPGRSEFTGTQADFSTFTISFVEPGVNTVGSFMIIDADLTDGFLCISDVVSNGPAFDQSIHRFTRRECPE